jgi:inner membrane protein
VAGNDTGYYVGLRSVFDSKKEITFQYFPRNDSLLDPLKEHEDVHKLIRFSQQFYTVEKWTDTLVFNDLRFGQIVGWRDPREKFVFHYFLDEGYDNKMVVQRGRFAKWDKITVKTLLSRIRGN